MNNIPQPETPRAAMLDRNFKDTTYNQWMTNLVDTGR